MPIKRNEYLQPLSREHHDGLLLCWKIRTGIKKNIDTTRIKAYVNWFWENHLVQHFATEEDYVFPILGNDHPLIIQAKAEHLRLQSLFEDQTYPEASIRSIEEELEKHIRFEERILFNEIQEVGSEEALKLIVDAHAAEINKKWNDEFWM